MSSLPIPDALQEAHSQQLARFIQNQISAAGGWIPFSDFMQTALYVPQLGYYSGGAKKFGIGGDFVTAPEISSLFGQALANQIAQVLKRSPGAILELGAGTGKLAVDILQALNETNCLPQHYFILEVSAHLQQGQRETIAANLSPLIAEKVVWLDQLPNTFSGVVLGNEVLDAIPVHLIYKTQGRFYMRGVAYQDRFVWQDRLLDNPQMLADLEKINLPDDYLTEVCPAAAGLISSVAQMLQSGLILMLDYGFSKQEYYHPQRRQGTLMCHYQHYAHTDPFLYLGLQDITAHVDFTRIAHAGVESGLEFGGYTTQAQFLINCGILDLLTQVSPSDVARYIPLAAEVHKLVSPAEMGDLFKVIAFVKAFDDPLMGFVTGDKSHTL